MISDSDYATCVRVLQALCRDPQAVQEGGNAAAVMQQAAALLRVGKSLRQRAQRQQDRASINNTGIRLRRAAAGDLAVQPTTIALPTKSTAVADDQPIMPEPAEVNTPAEQVFTKAGALLGHRRRCYICKTPFYRLHFFYDSLCASCAAENYQRRTHSVDLVGRVALVTGARLKIGFAVALKLLRAGATVLATTRFPADAQRRYAREPDYASWSHRLHLHGLDLRNLPSIEAFTEAASAGLTHLDILINNAAQTIRRPEAFYRHLRAGEVTAEAAPGRLIAPALMPPPQPQAMITEATTPLLSPQLTREDTELQAYFPAGQFDSDGQPVDLRPDNSWTLRLAEVSTAELLEVHAINCIAPFILMRRLQPLLLRSPHMLRFIVNVSSMEGVFAGRQKSARHPHTNMAKAALNMLTHTCAGDLAARGIFVNSVDTGWVTNEFPWPLSQRMNASGFQPPLDEIDGAARVCEPIFSGLDTGAPVFGQLLKDYRVTAW